jgi:DNA-binding transcriptional LysR family regulator
MKQSLRPVQPYDLNLVVALVALLETRSVTRAAARIHLSVPATSRVLGRLRETFGDPLLVRAGSRLVATPRGEALLQPARDALAAARALREVGAAPRLSETSHRFVVRLPVTLAVIVAAPLCEAMSAAMPGASLALVSEFPAPGDALRDGGLDLHVGEDGLALPELRSTLLSAQATVGVVRAGHPLARGAPSAARLARTGRVRVAAGVDDPDPLGSALRGLGFDSRAALSVPNAYAAIAVAARSDLLACVPDGIARAVAGALGVRVVRLPVSLPGERMVMSWHPRTEASPGHAWLRARLAATMDAKGPSGARGTPVAVPAPRA